MGILQRIGRKVSGALGRDSKLVTALRPAYNAALYVTTGGRGVLETFNGRERLRLDPWTRYHFPATKDPEVCAYLRSHVKPGAVCLNVGAHVGLYALFLAEWAGPTGRVFAFEPNPHVRRVLERHVKLNHFGDRVEALGVALSSSVGECTFCAEGLEVHSRIDRPNPGAAGHAYTSVTVPMTTLDEFCRTRGLAPDCITLDIEGTEIEALASGRECIRAGRGRLELIVELHPHLWDVAGTSLGRLKEVLADLELRPVPLTGQKDPLTEYGIVRLEYV